MKANKQEVNRHTPHDLRPTEIQTVTCLCRPCPCDSRSCDWERSSSFGSAEADKAGSASRWPARGAGTCGRAAAERVAAGWGASSRGLQCQSPEAETRSAARVERQPETPRREVPFIRCHSITAQATIERSKQLCLGITRTRSVYGPWGYTIYALGLMASPTLSKTPETLRSIHFMEPWWMTIEISLMPV